MSRRPQNNFQNLFKNDLNDLIKQVAVANPGIGPSDVVRKATEAMLQNNPFVPPKEGCPINDLPNELLAHIFKVGVEVWEDEDEWDEEEGDEGDDWETDSDEDEGIDAMKKRGGKKGEDEKENGNEAEEEEQEKDDRKRRMPFQMLASHVCRQVEAHWREVALETPTLWTSMEFTYGSNLESAKVWIERSQTQPLDITIDASSLEEDWNSDDSDDSEDEEDQEHAAQNGPAGAQASTEKKPPKLEPQVLSNQQISNFLDIIIPHVDRWRGFRLVASQYDRIFPVLKRLAQCKSASILESIELYHHDEPDEYEVFPEAEFKEAFVLFNANVPQLRNAVFWGVHVDWEGSLSMLTRLRELELAYHSNDVRPSFETFAKLVTASSNTLEVLSLSMSGPAMPPSDEKWPEELIPVEITSLKELILAHHEVKYIKALYPVLSTPNVVGLSLDYDTEDYTELAFLLAAPQKDRRTSLLAQLQQLKITGLPSNTKGREAVLEQLVNLKLFNLNCCDEEEEEYFTLLGKANTTPDGVAAPLYCPNLTSMYTTGIHGKQMRAFVEARRQAGVPLKRVGMSENDEIDEKDEKWLKDNVEEVEFFEPDSDFEDDDMVLEEISDSDIEMEVY